MTSTVLEIPKAPTYGAIEIKEFIRKNTWKGFIITMILVILFFVLYYGAGALSEEKEVQHFVVPISSQIVTQAPSADEEVAEEVEPPPKDVVQLATKARAGTPVPVPDAEIQQELKEFAAFDEIDQSLAANEGQVIDLSQMPDDIDLGDRPIEVEKEDLPDIDDFVFVEKEPQVDLVELQKKIIYPEMAKRAGIEGKVTVRVLVGKDGKPIKAVVQQSDSELLNKAAVKAVMESVFTPAIQNQQPVATWVSIPINFTLR
jgi:TonB family protein